MAEAVGGITGTLQGTANNVANMGSGYLDKFFPPEKRQELSAKISKFASEKPMFASFLLSQIALSGIPLALFGVMTLGVIVFALVAALVVGLLGALLFIVFCVGIALIILLPTLFFTTFLATFIWLWGVGAYYIVKKFNEKKIPGVHTGFVEGMTGSDGPLGDLGALKGGATSGNVQKSGENGEKGEKGEQKQLNGVTEKVPGGNKVGDATKASEGIKDKANPDQVTKTAKGATGGVTGAAPVSVPGT